MLLIKIAPASTGTVIIDTARQFWIVCPRKHIISSLLWFINQGIFIPFFKYTQKRSDVL